MSSKLVSLVVLIGIAVGLFLVCYIPEYDANAVLAYLQKEGFIPQNIETTVYAKTRSSRENAVIFQVSKWSKDFDEFYKFPAAASFTEIPKSAEGILLDAFAKCGKQLDKGKLRAFFYKTNGTEGHFFAIKLENGNAYLILNQFL